MIAIPMWAFFNDPTSLVPSPHINVFHPILFKKEIIKPFWEEVHLAKTETFSNIFFIFSYLFY